MHVVLIHNRACMQQYPCMEQDLLGPMHAVPADLKPLPAKHEELDDLDHIAIVDDDIYDHLAVDVADTSQLAQWAVVLLL